MPVHKMSDKELQLHIRAVILLILSMIAIAMMAQVYQQNWDSRVTSYPTKTEEAINNYAKKILGEMTLEEKVGQMFFAMDTADSERAVELGLGGLLLSERNLENLSKSEVNAVVSSFQTGSAVPMFIGANEEGGIYNTVSRYPALRQIPFLSPAELMTTGGISLVESDAEDKSELLRSLGVNVNFAPVCDVATADGAYMYGRALGREADDTARYAEAVVKTMNDEGVIGVLKHFPGYGNNTDTHTAMALDERALEILEREDLLPFRAGFQAGADAVMVSHTVVSALDSQLPASLSEAVHNYLRQNMGFAGVIITDDLKMAAISESFGDEEAAVQAVLAGNDMLCLLEYEEQYSAVLHAAETGEISMTKLDEAVLRILRWKIELGILHTNP